MRAANALQRLRKDYDAGNPEWLRLFSLVEIALSAYRHHGAGSALYRAHRLHREAWRLWRDDSHAQQVESEGKERIAREGLIGVVTTGDRFIVQQEEILQALDPIIRSIEELAVTMPDGSDAEKLADVRQRLRIGMGRTAKNADARETHWIACAAVKQEIAAMARSGAAVTKKEINRRAAVAVALPLEAVKRAWLDYRKSRPDDAQWEDDIRASLRKAPHQSARNSDRKGAQFRKTKLSRRSG